MAAARGARQNEIDKKSVVQFSSFSTLALRIPTVTMCPTSPSPPPPPPPPPPAACFSTVKICTICTFYIMRRRRNKHVLFSGVHHQVFFRIGGPKLIMSSMVTTITTSHNHALIYERACICDGGAPHCMHVFGDPSVRRSGRKTGLNDTFNNGAMMGTLPHTRH